MRAWRVRAALALLLAAGWSAAQNPPAQELVVAKMAAKAPSACPPVADGRSAAPADRGLLWRITRDGRSSYLFGTVHVGKPGWRRFGPRTAAALRETDTLALELDPGDPAIMAALMLQPAGPTLSPELQKRLADATERACLPPAALANLHPVLQATTLTMLDARWLGYDPGFSLETLLAERTRAHKRRVVSLESAESQKAALVPRDPDEARALVEQSLAQLEDLTTRRVLQRLVVAWEHGDLATLADYERWCECAATEDERALLRKLNDERNPHLADRITSLHRQGRRVFAAVGALHMTGQQALPALLAARGFRVERITFGP